MGKRHHRVQAAALLAVMLTVGGCAHRLAKPDAASPQGQTPPTTGDVSSDERHFQEMMDLLRKLKAEESKPVPPAPASSSAPE